MNINDKKIIEEKKHSNMLLQIKKENICDNIFLLYNQKYLGLINYEIQRIVDQKDTVNIDNYNVINNINLSIDIWSKNIIMSLIEQQNDNDIYEVIGRWLASLFINMIRDPLINIIFKKDNIKNLSKKINNLIQINIEDQIEKEYVNWILSNSFLTNIINNNIIDIIHNQKELVILNISQKIKDKVWNSIIKNFKYIDLLSEIIYLSIWSLIHENNVKFNLYYENFEIILNSIEFNHQRELAIYNTFLIFNRYLSDINKDIIKFNNLFLINKDVFLCQDSLVKLDDTINFSVLEATPNSDDLKLYILEELSLIVDYQKEYIEKYKIKNITIKSIDITFARNIDIIIDYIVNLYKDNNKDIISIIKKYYETYNYKISNNIWKIDNFISFTNELFWLNKIKIKFNKNYYFINKIIDNKFKNFKKEYYINSKIKDKINLLLNDIYKKIYIKEVFNKKGTISNILLLWPTWSWKTYLAKALSKELWTPLVKIDASFLKSDHSFTNIVWAPPSYIGSDTLNDWQKKVKQINNDNKVGVLLIDEIEKAHPSILDLFLGLLDEGEIILSNGIVLDLSKFIVIFTSNLIQDKNNENRKVWFKPLLNITQKDNKYWVDIKEKLLKFFKPELLWRINNIEFIPGYKKEDLEKIYTFIANKFVNQYRIDDTLKKEINKILLKEKEKIITKVINTKENIRLLSGEIENIFINNIVINL